ncbi:SRPBCC domain-containing protein [Flavobacteriaceae bacterium S356]|uniref:SRPBCC domain-containing protein n=1 Tax=Asprobacillus argus TaxID=3076534 RepID=A0ABU3LHJ7_9FLAO|nr:SRPBCC domain-containing protein [Flavobacteriaceae bacterium S356]
MEKTGSNTGFAIYHNFVIHATAKEVFDAVSLPEHLNNWWPLQSSGIPAVGNRYNFNFTDTYNWFGHVSTCEPSTSFFIKMTESDADWSPTTFGFELEEMDGGVSVKFSHTNWPQCNTEFKQSSYCWAILLNGLKNYVEKGIVIPFEDRE